jgi:hypothetical protein
MDSIYRALKSYKCSKYVINGPYIIIHISTSLNESITKVRLIKLATIVNIIFVEIL